MLPLVCSWEWYPNNKGLVTGIIVCAYGLSSLIFAPIIMGIINPENLSPSIFVNQDLILFDNQVSAKFPIALRYVIRIWALMLMLSMMLISRPEAKEDVCNDEAKK